MSAVTQVANHSREPGCPVSRVLEEVSRKSGGWNDLYLLFCPSERSYYSYFLIDFQPTEFNLKFFTLIIYSHSIQRFLCRSDVTTPRATHPVWEDRRALRGDVEALQKKYY